jgi:hypothetical protein
VARNSPVVDIEGGAGRRIRPWIAARAKWQVPSVIVSDSCQQPNVLLCTQIAVCLCLICYDLLSFIYILLYRLYLIHNIDKFYFFKCAIYDYKAGGWCVFLSYRAARREFAVRAPCYRLGLPYMWLIIAPAAAFLDFYWSKD